MQYGWQFANYYKQQRSSTIIVDQEVFVLSVQAINDENKLSDLYKVLQGSLATKTVVTVKISIFSMKYSEGS